MEAQNTEATQARGRRHLEKTAEEESGGQKKEPKGSGGYRRNVDSEEIVDPLDVPKRCVEPHDDPKRRADAQVDPDEGRQNAQTACRPKSDP